MLLVIAVWVLLFMVVYEVRLPRSKNVGKPIVLNWDQKGIKGVHCKMDDKAYFIETHETEICPFCKSEDIFSGSWANECCKQCNASHMLGVWLLPRELGEEDIENN